LRPKIHDPDLHRRQTPVEVRNPGIPWHASLAFPTPRQSEIETEIDPVNSKHIVRSYDEELGSVIDKILRMGHLGQNQLARSISALIARDTAAAEEIIARDREIDTLEDELDDLVVEVLARRQPVAEDLRLVISTRTMGTAFERVGDYAANIAKRTLMLSGIRIGIPLRPLEHLARLVNERLETVIRAFEQRDSEAALDVWWRDSEVDELYTSLFREFLTYMMEDTRNIAGCTHLLFIAKNLERCGDHATNIAEMVYFLVEGKRISAERPKRDRSVAVTPTGTLPAND